MVTAKDHNIFEADFADAVPRAEPPSGAERRATNKVMAALEALRAAIDGSSLTRAPAPIPGSWAIGNSSGKPATSHVAEIDALRPPYEIHESGPTIGSSSSEADAHTGLLSVSIASWFHAPSPSSWASATATLGVALEPAESGRLVVQSNVGYEAEWSAFGAYAAYNEGHIAMSAVNSEGSLLDRQRLQLWRTDTPARAVVASATNHPLQQRTDASTVAALEVEFEATAGLAYMVLVHAAISGGPGIIVSSWPPGWGVGLTDVGSSLDFSNSGVSAAKLAVSVPYVEVRHHAGE